MLGNGAELEDTNGMRSGHQACARCSLLVTCPPPLLEACQSRIVALHDQSLRTHMGLRRDQRAQQLALGWFIGVRARLEQGKEDFGRSLALCGRGYSFLHAKVGVAACGGRRRNPNHLGGSRQTEALQTRQDDIRNC